MPPLLALYAKQFLEIQLFTSWKQISENGWLGTNVLLDQRFIVRRSSPLTMTLMRLIAIKHLNRLTALTITQSTTTH